MSGTIDTTLLRSDAATARFEARKALQQLSKARGNSRQAAERAFDAAASAYEHARVRCERALELTGSGTGFEFGSSVRVGKELTTYRRGGAHSFLQDQRKASFGDGPARERLERHGRELAGAGVIDQVEARAIGEEAGKGAALVAPAYMQDWLVAFARAGRPYVDALSKQPLPAHAPEVKIPCNKTGGEAAPQADLATVEEVEPSTQELASIVATIPGNILVGQQLFDRAVPELADQVFFPDLGQAVLAKTDIQALTGSGEGDNLLGVLGVGVGVNSIMYTSGAPTMELLLKAIAEAKLEVWKGIYLPANIIVMSPARWESICNAFDGSKRPFVTPHAFPASVADQLSGDEGDHDTPAGILSGLRVIVDASIPTKEGAGKNQDVIIVQRAEESWWLEDMDTPALRTQVSTDIAQSDELVLRLTAFQYGAVFHTRRPKGISVISGTGLTTPTL